MLTTRIILLKRRLLEHKIGRTKSLRKLLPIKLVFAEKYDSITQTRKIEAKLKKLKSRRIIEKIIKNGKITVRV
jgi:predicted GIY-YIG superfamily endonuclease